METVAIELFVLVDSEGNFGHGDTAELAVENYNDNWTIDGPTRMLRVCLTLPAPAPTVLTGVVPAESAEGVSLRVE